MKIGVEFDANGKFVSDFLEGMTLPAGHTLFKANIAAGFYRPKFVNGQVVEGMTQDEIDAIRNQPQPITQEEQMSNLEESAQTLDERTTGMQAIDDFTLQAQSTIDERTVGMQEIDDFTLLQVTDLQQQVDQLKADVAALKGGV